MLQLLQPIWLFALAGISIPLIIHLWNRKPGKIIKIGSIAFMPENARQHTRRLKLSDLLLLLLRCLLLSLIAFVLAKPFWNRQPDFANQKGWILIDNKSANQAYPAFKTQIDSLLKAGFELHSFDTAFKKESLSEALAANDSAISIPSSYWSLLAVLNDRVPATFPLHLFTGRSLKNFYGTRPLISLNLSWHSFVPVDTLAGDIASAYLTGTDSIRVVLENSRPAGIFYTVYDMNQHGLPDRNIRVFAEENRRLVSFENRKPVEIDTSTMRITLYTDKYPQDAMYVQAAIDAIQQFSKRKIKLAVVHEMNAVPHQQDWLFWLSDTPIPENLETGKIFFYQHGKEQPVRSWLTGYRGQGFAAQLSLYKSINNNDTASTLLKTIWRDGFGHPVLALENKKGASLYHFYSRFNPGWSDLPWNSGFPALLYKLIDEKEEERLNVMLPDMRTIDSLQMQPALTKDNEHNLKNHLQPVDLAGVFWMAIFILFFIERIVSFQHKQVKRNARI